MNKVQKYLQCIWTAGPEMSSYPLRGMVTYPKMPNFTTNQKFLENFVLIFAKDNTDSFLFVI